MNEMGEIEEAEEEEEREVSEESDGPLDMTKVKAESHQEQPLNMSSEQKKKQQQQKREIDEQEEDEDESRLMAATKRKCICSEEVNTQGKSKRICPQLSVSNLLGLMPVNGLQATSTPSPPLDQISIKEEDEEDEDDEEVDIHNGDRLEANGSFDPERLKAFNVSCCFLILLR